MYLIKIKTKRGHCTPDWAPWSHILGNTARSTPHSTLHTLSRDQTTKKRMSDAKNGFQAGELLPVASPGPAQHTHFLCILTQLPVTTTHQHGDLSLITYASPRLSAVFCNLHLFLFLEV